MVAPMKNLQRQTVLITARLSVVSQNQMQVSNTFTEKVISCPSKENAWRFKNICCKHMANYKGVKLGKVTCLQQQKSCSPMTS